MSHNPSRRLKRAAMHAYGWSCNQPKSGRRRGTNRRTAEANVEKAKQLLNGKG